LAKDQGVKSSERVANAVKELEEQKKLMEEMPGTELAERTKRLRQACFKANYKKRRLIGPLQCAISAPPPTKVRIPPFHNQPSIVLDFERGSSHHIGFL
jgi:benzoyl-CoA reductase/2-hydroxyglutaryl-CoA dehydratase subunit BcrC/BadD/HgdB